MYTSCKHSNAAIHTIIDLLILASVLIPGSRLTLASEETPNEAGAMVLVLEDCDTDNKLSTDPYGDTASLLNSKGELIRKFRGLRINSTFSGSRNISVSEDGCFYVVCERFQVCRIRKRLDICCERLRCFRN